MLRGLSEYKVNLIRNLYNRGFSTTQIGLHLSIPQQTVNNITRRRTYKDVPFFFIDTSDVNLSSGKGKLTSDIVSFIKTHGYKICFNKFKVDYDISRSVFYSIIRGELYKGLSMSKFDIDIEKYKKDVKKSKIELVGLYIKRKNVTENKSGVYIIQNIVNEKCYVGSSYNIKKRLQWHYNLLEQGYHPNNILQSAINKYGIDKFQFVPVLNCPSEYNHILEQFIKDKSGFNSKYNIAINCKTSALGNVLSDETKLKISKKNKGRKWTDEQRNRLKKRLKDIKDTDKQFDKNRIKNIGNPRKGSDNPRSKLSEEMRLDIIDRINKGERNKDIQLIYPYISQGLISEVRCGRTWKHLQNLIIR